MERRALGPNGFEVPVVGMGTSRTLDVRGRAAEATSRRIVEEALAAEANLFDSSPMYGEAERVLGLALDGRRDEAIVATKIWTADDDQAERQIETSLRHAHGHIELYQIHNLVAWPARLERLERLRDAERPVDEGLSPGELRMLSMLGLPNSGPGPVKLLVENEGLTLENLQAAVRAELDRDH